MKSKKADGNTVWIVVVIALALLFFTIYGSFVFKGFRSGFEDIGSGFDSTGDEDSDGVLNAYDKCPCPGGEGSKNNKGCPTTHTIQNNNQGLENRDCFKEENNENKEE